MELDLLGADALREALVAIALEWQRRYGVAPAITSAISEYDAARMVGHSPESFALDGVGRTAVTRGVDFCHGGLRYQVKACRPSGKPGSFVTKVPKALNYDWDRLIWILYDREYRVLEAWEWLSDAYRSAFHEVERLSPAMMRNGRALHPRVASEHEAAEGAGILAVPQSTLHFQGLQPGSIRICPKPRAWLRIYQQLMRHARSNTCFPSEPPVPLILAGWAHSVSGWAFHLEPR